MSIDYIGKLDDGHSGYRFWNHSAKVDLRSFGLNHLHVHYVESGMQSYDDYLIRALVRAIPHNVYIKDLLCGAMVALAIRHMRLK